MKERTDMASDPRWDSSHNVQTVSIPDRLRSSTQISAQPIVPPELVSTTGQTNQNTRTFPLAQ
jgi:hypothetical protein